jgi:transcriptional regulator with XRE-family HTH domain
MDVNPPQLLGFPAVSSQTVIQALGVGDKKGTVEQGVRDYFKGLVGQAAIKQSAIATAIGKSQPWLSQYLGAQRGARITLDDLESLAGYFNRTLASVVTAVGRAEPPMLSADERWLALGRALKKKDREYFEGTIRALVQAKGSNRARPRTRAKNSESGE